MQPRRQPIDPTSHPAMDVRIQIDRTHETLRVPDAEIHYRGPHHAPPPHLAQQLHWVVADGLLPDELLIIFGKPLDWSGPNGPAPESLPLVESPFCAPYTMSRARTEVWSGIPDFEFPSGVDAVGWLYGIVLIRGHDTPLLVDPMVRIQRA